MLDPNQPEIQPPALAESHQNFIISCLDHLLVFPTDVESLKQEVQKLQEAIRFPHDNHNEYHDLAQCLYYPTKKLLRLEDQNSQKILIIDVKKFLVNLINERLAESIHEIAEQLKVNVSFADLGWDDAQVMNKIVHRHDPTRKFTSQPPETRTVFEWQNVHSEEDSIFSYKMIYREDEPFIALHVHITLPDGKTENIIVNDFHLAPGYSELNYGARDQNEFLNRLIFRDAKEQATTHALEAIINYLQDVLDIDDWIANSLYEAGAAKLITQHFYLQLLLSGQIDIAFFLQLEIKEADVLKLGIAKKLYREKICSFDRIKKFTESELKLISYFYPLISDKVNSIDDFINLPEEHTKKIIFHPLIINLIISRRLKLNIAKNLPIEFRKLLYYYNEYFMRADIDWEEMTKLNKFDCQLLSDNHIKSSMLDENPNYPTVKKLVENNILDINRTHELSRLARTAIKKFNVASLLLHRKLSIDKLQTFSRLAFEVINDEDKRLLTWVLANVINLEESAILPVKGERTMYRDVLYDLYTDVFAERFFAILLNRQFTINEHEDSIQELEVELNLIAAEKHLDKQFLHANVMREYLNKVEDYLDELQNQPSATREDIDNIEALQESMHLANVEHRDDPDITLSYLTKTAREIEDRIENANYQKHNLTFFNPLHANKIATFCTEIQKINPMLDLPIERDRKRRRLDVG